MPKSIKEVKERLEVLKGIQYVHPKIEGAVEALEWVLRD